MTSEVDNTNRITLRTNIKLRNTNFCLWSAYMNICQLVSSNTPHFIQVQQITHKKSATNHFFSNLFHSGCVNTKQESRTNRQYITSIQQIYQKLHSISFYLNVNRLMSAERKETKRRVCNFPNKPRTKMLTQ
jgi:hypothetical protein